MENLWKMYFGFLSTAIVLTFLGADNARGQQLKSNVAPERFDHDMATILLAAKDNFSAITGSRAPKDVAGGNLWYPKISLVRGFTCRIHETLPHFPRYYDSSSPQSSHLTAEMTRFYQQLVGAVRSATGWWGKPMRAQSQAEIRPNSGIFKEDQEMVFYENAKRDPLSAVSGTYVSVKLQGYMSGWLIVLRVGNGDNSR